MNDLFNLERVESTTVVDSLNGDFYSEYNYPWPPTYFQKFSNGEFYVKFLNQEIGFWQQNRVKKDCKIWVAGCGTNQAIFTALRFPDAKVLGTDISTKSIQVCRKNMKSLGITNLEIEEQSLNNINYQDEFDYIICTGVVHHNAYPEQTLGQISKALKINGVMELMVYNYYHRFLTTAFQKALQIMDPTKENYFDMHLKMASKILNKFPVDGSMKNFLETYIDAPEAKIADALIQPVEYSYTVSTLEELLSSCGLEYLAPCINQFDKDENKIDWNIDFKDAELNEIYENLPDMQRWQMSNLLLQEKSPMLWFYCQRTDATQPKYSEKDSCEKFLDSILSKAETSVENYILDRNGNYVKSNRIMSFPVPPQPLTDCEKQIHSRVNGKVRMHDIFEELGKPMSWTKVLGLKNRLTTPLFPYLVTN